MCATDILRSGRIIAKSSDLPMADEHAKNEFFVRDCFPVYYSYLVDNLDSGRRYVSVTGTPGIGKSVFYIYFFNRFRAENPFRTIVTASFSNDRTPQACSVFHPGDADPEQVPPLKYIPGALYLFDGPPKIEPQGEQMICFTSPNLWWFSNMKKVAFHSRIIMPPWDEAELQEANSLLGLGLDQVTVSGRYSFFGGIAGYCLSCMNEIVEDAKKTISSRSRSITSYRNLRDCLRYQSPDAQPINHSIFHMIPIVETGTVLKRPRSFVFDFASIEIQTLIQRNFDHNDEDEMSEFIRFVRSEPEAARVAEKIFKANQCPQESPNRIGAI